MKMLVRSISSYILSTVLFVAFSVSLNAQACHWQGNVVICCTEYGCTWCTLVNGKKVCGELSITKHRFTTIKDGDIMKPDQPWPAPPELTEKQKLWGDWINERKSQNLPLVYACEMSVGQKGRVINPHSEHFGKILIRVNNGAVQFDGEPKKDIATWSGGGPESHPNGPFVEVIND